MSLSQHLVRRQTAWQATGDADQEFPLGTHLDCPLTAAPPFLCQADVGPGWGAPDVHWFMMQA
eukprot:CAMPEP_0174351974 /NCGR_PEP_ID=MMETSP0811_2-20130205/9513_1 /TAXON_ID=73025 ORGANISM="Eutreptiella gymnastica-like, Strain CCMP1594" /NCGR_SAMPLE_ID=MMETSP0811_2 /ASSEMBLY_ACC=CAM_ASM_000667 /LENGTH=62 /DNA_ID=CAMNT_0015481751 /DNA_START=391 /DNA_END=579 /DNA_ORIENTATION=+